MIHRIREKLNMKFWTGLILPKIGTNPELLSKTMLACIQVWVSDPFDRSESNFFRGRNRLFRAACGSFFKLI
jgi:hypothetical protein